MKLPATRVLQSLSSLLPQILSRLLGHRPIFTAYRQGVSELGSDLQLILNVNLSSRCVRRSTHAWAGANSEQPARRNAEQRRQADSSRASFAGEYMPRLSVIATDTFPTQRKVNPKPIAFSPSPSAKSDSSGIVVQVPAHLAVKNHPAVGSPQLKHSTQGTAKTAR